MKQLGKRMGAFALMLAVAVGSTACSISGATIKYTPIDSDSPTVLTVNGTNVSQKEYAHYFKYNMTYYESQYAQYGMTDIWDDPQFGPMLGEGLPESAKDMAVYMTVMQQKIEEFDVKVTKDQQKVAQDNIKSQIEQAGSEDKFWNQIARFGFDKQMYYNFLYTSMAYESLNDYFYGENGIERVSDEEISTYFNENYVKAKNILIGTTDTTTGEAKRTLEEAKALADEAVAKLDAGEDFDTVLSEYNEDPGMENNAGGYVFKDGDMVPEFYNKTVELEDNAYGVVETDYGMHIVQKLPLEESDLDQTTSNGQSTNRETIAQTLGNMDEKLNTWLTEAEVETMDLFDEINYQNIDEYLIDAPVYVPEETEDETTQDDTAQGDTTDTADTTDDAAANDDTAADDAATDASADDAAAAE